MDPAAPRGPRDMSIEASATESQRADSSATENLPATKSSDDTLHRGWPQWRRSLQAKFDGVVNQQEEHELIVSILRRIQEVLSTGDWKDSPSSLEEVTNLVEFVSTCNVSNNYVRSQISQVVRHAGRVGITVTTQPGATWYTCHQCSRAFKTWSLCLEHLRTEGHMGVTAATTDRGQIERMKNLCAEDEPTMVDGASRVSAPDSKIKRRVGLVQAVVHPSLEKLAKNVLHFAIHGTAPQTTEYLKKHALMEASIDGFEQNSAAEPTARPSAAQKRVSGKSTDPTQRDDVEAPLQQPSQKATPDHHDGATHRQHQQHQLEERHKQPEIVQQQSKEVQQSRDGGQRPRRRRQQHRSSHHSTQRTGETPAGCEHSTSVTSLNSTSSHGNGRWLFIKSYRLQNMRTHTNTATNANEQMSTSTPFHSRQFSSSRVNPCHALPQPCDKLEEWVLGNHFSALN